MMMPRHESDERDERDWAELQQVLLVSIVDRLTPAEQIRFATVCTSWYLAFLAGGCSRPPPQAPWLLVGSSERNDTVVDAIRGDGNMRFGFVSPFESWRPHKMRSSVSLEWGSLIVVGMSPDGWLFIVDPRPQIWAVNPITREQILLPPPPNINLYRNKCHRVAMSSPWDAVGHKMFAASFGSLNRGRFVHVLALARQGAPDWSIVNIPGIYRVISMTYSNGEFFILITEIEKQTYCILSVGACQPPQEPRILIRLGYASKEMWLTGFHSLLVSPSGDEVFLACHVHARPCVKCFRLDVGDGGANLVPLHSLGLNALMLGKCSSLMIPTIRVPQLRENYVYSQRLGIDVVMVYNLENGESDSVHGFRRGYGWFLPGVL